MRPAISLLVGFALAIGLSACGGQMFVEPETGESVEAGQSEVAESVVRAAAKVEIPEGCTTWFDGCNTCEVVDGELGACTRKACKGSTAEPGCLRSANLAEAEAVPETVREVRRDALEVPESCVIWFDGCNDCVVRAGKLVGCTSKSCATNEQAFCRKSR